MTTNEEKIKAFLNDEEKVKALANDTEFLEKVSGGQATNEIYKKEFEKFDIKLSDQDAEKTKDVVNKMLEKTPDKIDDKFLKDVVGGIGGGKATLNTITTLAAGATFISGLGCSVASCVYMAKANNARSSGDNASYEQFIKKSQNCGIATAALFGTAGITGLIAYETSPSAEEIAKMRKEAADNFNKTFEMVSKTMNAGNNQ